MKQRVRALGVLLAVFLVLASVPMAVTAAPADADLRYGRTVLTKMENSENLLYAYDQLVSGVATGKSEIPLDYEAHGIIWDELTTVYRIFHSDYPEYFWLDGGFSGSYISSSGRISEVRPGMTMSGSQLATAKTAFANKVKELTAGLGGKSDYEKAKLLHDRLADTTTYVRNANDQNAYGALVEGKAVCAGYSRAYQHLMHQAGLPAWVVIGTSRNPSTNNDEGHEWNLVQLDGRWYHTDVTWDDQGETRYYAYFNVATDRIEEDHVIKNFASYVPVSDATEANYFVKNDRIYPQYDRARLAAHLKAGDGTTRVYVTGNKEEFINGMKEDMRELVKAMGAPKGSGYSYNTRTLGREIILTVRVVEPDHKHKLTAVKAKEATCSAGGNKAYYTCSCGHWFSDADGKQEIADKSTVTLPAKDHTPSGWKSDSTDHWKECTACGAEIAGSHKAHVDADTNKKCDTCGKTLVVAGAGTSVDAAATTTTRIKTTVRTTTRTTQTAAGTTAADTDVTTTGSAPEGSTTAGTEPSADGSSTGAETGETLPTGSLPTEDAPEDMPPPVPGPNPLLYVLIGGGVVLVAGAAVAVVLYRKGKK